MVMVMVMTMEMVMFLIHVETFELEKLRESVEKLEALHFRQKDFDEEVGEPLFEYEVWSF